MLLWLLFVVINLLPTTVSVSVCVIHKSHPPREAEEHVRYTISTNLYNASNSHIKGTETTPKYTMIQSLIPTKHHHHRHCPNDSSQR